MSFEEQLREASERYETKADIIEYYQSQYPARGSKKAQSWKQRLVTDLAAQTGMKPKNLEKRFDTQRRHNVEPRNAGQYRELGDMLPFKAPDNGYHIYGTVWVKYTDDNCEPREIDETITGEDADELAAAADDAIQGVINYYQTGDVNGDGPAWCADPELSVEAV